MSVPIATSPGRGGFGPPLSVSYDSGAGNGIFGLGWNLSIPSIGRKTDKDLPRYWDEAEPDVFMLSGAEDLVPVLKADGSRKVLDSPDGLFKICRYRPRIEGLFARIERWTEVDSGEIHWRSISKDNITRLYGQTKESRIFDPTDPTHVFTWLICESYDNRGNVIRYQYKAEDSVGLSVVQTLSCGLDTWPIFLRTFCTISCISYPSCAFVLLISTLKDGYISCILSTLKMSRLLW